MKFKLPRQIVNPEIYKIVSREVRKQKVYVIRASINHLKEIVEVSRAIETNGLPKHLVCKKLPRGLGFGIFLRPDAKPILKGEVIAPYAGEISLVQQNEFDDSVYAFAPLLDILCTKKEQALLDKTCRFHPRRLYSSTCGRG